MGDISSKDSIQSFRSLIEKEHGGIIHPLINNAAMAFKFRATEPFSQQARETVANNYLGHLNVCETLFPLVATNGCVINVASSSGRLKQVSAEHQKTLLDAKDIDTISSLMQKFVDTAQNDQHKKAGFSNSAYGMSKLGMITSGRVHAKQMADRNISVINMNPGWCKTDMAGWVRPPKSAADGADTVVWLEIKTPQEQMGLSGKFFEERQEVQW